MNNFNPALAGMLFENPTITETCRITVENVVNELLKTELTEFLDYEKHDPIGYNSGDSRNGFYPHKIQTFLGEIAAQIPRDRNGDFKNHTIPSYKHSDQSLEAMVIQLYKKGITTREISSLIEQMYGHHYSPQTISHITLAVEDQAKAFHSRPIEKRYAVIYCDATFINLRRDSVAKEALHVMIGVTPGGDKEVLDYALYPSESVGNYRDMLEDLKARGLEQVLLFVTDGLVGLRDMFQEVFPYSKHQSCWVHVDRNVLKNVRRKDYAVVAADLKLIYRADNKELAMLELEHFDAKYCKLYPKAVKSLRNNQSLFTFYDFPKPIWRSIYTSNLIEGVNKELKKSTHKKEQFPNEDSLDRFACVIFCEINRRYDGRSHNGFKNVGAELREMFV